MENLTMIMRVNKMEKEEKRLRIEGCLTKETEKDFAKIKVKRERDIEEIAKRTGSPIFECKEKGEVFTLDPKNRLKFFKKGKE